MRYRILGRTGLSVSEVGFGGGGIGAVYGETTEEASIRAVERALELGINFFDVAPMYGDGTAERVLGKALSGKRREEVVIETKVSVPLEAFDRDLKGHVRRSLEQSLTLLGTDHVDVFNTHNTMASMRERPVLPPFDTVIVTAADAVAIAEAFVPLRDEGLVRFFGFTSWRCTRSALVEILDSGVFDVTLVEYNLLHPTALYPPVPGQDVTPMETFEALPDADLAAWSYRPIDQHQAIPLAAERGLGVINLRPLAAGALSSGFDRPDEPGHHMDLVNRRAAALGFLTGSDRRTLAQTAIRFCLAVPEIATVIPGAKNAAEIEDAAAASELGPLDAETVARVIELARSDFGVPIEDVQPQPRTVC